VFLASLDVRESSLARAAALPFVAWRPREASARPLPDALPPRKDRDQR
jgi:hypothetical protein